VGWREKRGRSLYVRSLARGRAIGIKTREQKRTEKKQHLVQTRIKGESGVNNTYVRRWGGDRQPGFFHRGNGRKDRVIMLKRARRSEMTKKEIS